MGNKNLQLSYANISNYPTPWTMWGGPTFKPGSHIGNVKIGPANTTCPEHFSVRLLSINLHFCICVALNTNVSMRRFLMLLMYGIGSNTYIFCSLRKLEMTLLKAPLYAENAFCQHVYWKQSGQHCHNNQQEDINFMRCFQQGLLQLLSKCHKLGSMG